MPDSATRGLIHVRHPLEKLFQGSKVVMHGANRVERQLRRWRAADGADGSSDFSDGTGRDSVDGSVVKDFDVRKRTNNSTHAKGSGIGSLRQDGFQEFIR